MRITAIATAGLLAAAAVATQAAATPADISVVVGAQLQVKAQETLGVREVDDLAQQLRKNVAERLAKSGAYDGARIELVLVDATPNHPTFKQLSDRPGLSLRSFGIGGATIEGRAVSPDGQVTPLRYSYTEPDIRFAHGMSTWGDAEETFQLFADELGRGKAPGAR
jgi:hypothetical protein